LRLSPAASLGAGQYKALGRFDQEMSASRRSFLSGGVIYKFRRRQKLCGLDGAKYPVAVAVAVAVVVMASAA
jgi:hypothetical protein